VLLYFKQYLHKFKSMRFSLFIASITSVAGNVGVDIALLFSVEQVLVVFAGIEEA